MNYLKFHPDLSRNGDLQTKGGDGGGDQEARAADRGSSVDSGQCWALGPLESRGTFFEVHLIKLPERHNKKEENNFGTFPPLLITSKSEVLYFLVV